MYKVIRRTETELVHHGILNQKWGIRRFQNKDGSLTPEGRKRYNNHDDDIIIKKGTQLNNLGSRKKTDLRDSPSSANANKLFVYREDNEHDKDVYEGAFSTYVKERDRYYYSILGIKPEVFKRQYQAAVDLISPSDEHRIDLFIEAYRDQPENFIDGLNRANARIASNPSLAPYLKRLYGRKRFNKKTSDKILRERGYGLFNTLNEWNSPDAVKANDAYYSKLFEAGYNALIDDNNAGKYNDAKEPLIVFNAKKQLNYIRSDQLSDADMAAAEQRLRAYLKEKFGTDTISF